MTDTLKPEFIVVHSCLLTWHERLALNMQIQSNHLRDHILGPEVTRSFRMPLKENNVKFRTMAIAFSLASIVAGVGPSLAQSSDKGMQSDKGMKSDKMDAKGGAASNGSMMKSDKPANGTSGSNTLGGPAGKTPDPANK